MKIKYSNNVLLHIALTLICFFSSLTSRAAGNDGMAFTAELLAGEQDKVGVISGYGTVTTPPSYPFTFHLEMVSDDTEDASLQGAGGHIYFHDARWGMLGLTAAKTNIDLAETELFPAINNMEVNTYGVEAEFNMAPFVLAFQTGRIDSDDIDFIDDDYLNFEIHWDVNKQWYLIAGSSQFSDVTTNYAEVNYSFYSSNYSLTPYLGVTWDDFDSVYLGMEIRNASKIASNWAFFFEVDRGEENYDAYFLGLRYEFGPVNAAPVLSLFQRNAGGYSFISPAELL